MNVHPFTTLHLFQYQFPPNEIHSLGKLAFLQVILNGQAKHLILYFNYGMVIGRSISHCLALLLQKLEKDYPELLDEFEVECNEILDTYQIEIV